MATVHRFPSRPLADNRAATGRRVADYRAAVEGLLAAGVTGHEAIAAALNAEPLYTPPGTAWDGAAVERLLGFLRLRPSRGHAMAAPGASYGPIRARSRGAPAGACMP